MAVDRPVADIAQVVMDHVQQLCFGKDPAWMRQHPAKDAELHRGEGQPVATPGDPQAGVIQFHSAQVQVIERFTVDRVTGSLRRDYRAEDPLYLQKPYQGSDVLQVADEPNRDFNCVELSGKNNLRTL